MVYIIAQCIITVMGVGIIVHCVIDLAYLEECLLNWRLTDYLTPIIVPLRS